MPLPGFAAVGEGLICTDIAGTVVVAGVSLERKIEQMNEEVEAEVEEEEEEEGAKLGNNTHWQQRQPVPTQHTAPDRIARTDSVASSFEAAVAVAGDYGRIDIAAIMVPPVVVEVVVAVEYNAGIVAGNFDRDPYLAGAEEEAVAAAVGLLEYYSKAGPRYHHH